MSEEEEIQKLKMEGMASSQDTPPKRKIEIIDALVTYGDKGVPAIKAILNSAMSPTTINYATDVLKNLKQ